MNDWVSASQKKLLLAVISVVIPATTILIAATMPVTYYLFNVRNVLKNSIIAARKNARNFANYL